MRLPLCLTILCSFTSITLFAQAPNLSIGDKKASQKENIYEIKKDFLYHVLHNPAEQHERFKNSNEKDEDDNELARFNRWFKFVEPRCYPTGDMPRPDIIIRETKKAVTDAKARSGKRTATANPWMPVGPMQVPINNNGIGRIDCIVIDPLDTNTLYVGAACGGVNISHDGGHTWTSNTDAFPSLSVADIAVNPVHTDTLYAATGDGYGYTTDSYNTFWGGLYSAGVMKSTDGGATWDTTGLSFIQSNREIIQKLLINPNHPNTLLAATTNGIWQTKDAGATWGHVYSADHVYAMAFRPGTPDTVYAVNNSNLIVSYDGGTSWSILYTGINPVSDRASIAVCAAAPDYIWVLDATENLHVSSDGGGSFTSTTTSPSATANFYGYYDRVLAVSPTNPLNILAYGMIMAVSANGGDTWTELNPAGDVHVDNHATVFNPLHPATIYTGNDGGISVTRNGGLSWTNLANGLMISQIYRMSSSQQNPDTMICGVQDNGTFAYNGTNWKWVTGGDGEACAISPLLDYYQVSSSQNGFFYFSTDAGNTFNYSPIDDTGSWTSPVTFDPSNINNIFFGMQYIWMSNDNGFSFSRVSGRLFPNAGANFLVVAPSDDQVLYAANQSKIFRTTNGGTSWTNVTGSLPVGSVAISRIAVDPRDPMRVFVSTSGYIAGKKVFLSTTGGTTWTNISQNLPNLPADCIAIDSSTPGALFVGTDMGVYYTDSSVTGWSLYETGLPNVIVNDIDVNYGNYKVRAATYGRGIWESNLKRQPVSSTKTVTNATPGIRIYPNPTTSTWNLQFLKQKPANFTVKVSDISGRTVLTQKDTYQIDATALASGVYNMEVLVNDARYNIKAIRK